MKKILVVDDEKDITELLRKKLSHSGYDVKTAANGKEAVELAAREPFDLIMMDIVMPVMDGYQACRILKDDVQTQNIPILLVTTKELEPQGVAQRREELQVAGCVAKPTSFQELLEKVKSIIG